VLVVLPYHGVSGTPVANCWDDICGLIALIDGQPVKSRQEFIKMFTQPSTSGHSLDIYGSRLNRLVGLLQGLTVGRPRSGLPLPELVEHDEKFETEELHDIKLILYLVRQFVEAMPGSGLSEPSDAAIPFATKALMLIR
jgi:hypothetical protein